MSVESPCVSVCLPVYNGERFVASAIRSVLAQTFTDFELIIADNASTDGSDALCSAAARGDPRIRYLKADSNGGLAWNWNRACKAARGRFVMWLACDDIAEPDLLRSCVEVLEADPDAVLCFTNRNTIDATGRVVGQLEPKNSGACELPAERFRDVLYDANCEPGTGVMRTDIVGQTRLMQGFADSDRVFLAELALRGRFRKLEQNLFSRRFHSDSVTASADRWARAVIFNPAMAGKVTFPWWLELFALVRAVLSTALPGSEKRRALKMLYWWELSHKDVLARDLGHGLLRLARFGGA